jgi:hypothetical protein
MGSDTSSHSRSRQLCARRTRLPSDIMSGGRGRNDILPLVVIAQYPQPLVRFSWIGCLLPICRG